MIEYTEYIKKIRELVPDITDEQIKDMYKQYKDIIHEREL